jgi:hypothetical protein
MKNYHRETKKHVENMKNWEVQKCAASNCNNEVFDQINKYCGRKNCTRVEETKLKIKLKNLSK